MSCATSWGWDDFNADGTKWLYWWEQQSLCFKLEAGSSRAHFSPIDGIHDKKLASMGPQCLSNRIDITQKWQQKKKNKESSSDMEEDGKGSVHPKRQKMWVKEKKVEIVVANGTLSQTLFADDGVLVFRVGSSQLGGTIYRTWKDPRQKVGFLGTLITDKQNRDNTTATSNGNSNNQILLDEER